MRMLAHVHINTLMECCHSRIIDKSVPTCTDDLLPQVPLLSVLLDCSESCSLSLLLQYHNNGIQKSFYYRLENKSVACVYRMSNSGGNLSQVLFGYLDVPEISITFPTTECHDGSVIYAIEVCCCSCSYTKTATSIGFWV